MERPIDIDGSQGEGGGQVLRSSLALALVTGRPVRVEHIRAGRKKPGLMRQHLAAVRAAAEIGAAEVRGADIGSQTVFFRPTAVKPGRHEFSVGSAGSATLVLQTVLPALLLADAPSELILEGGTHNPWAPPYDFLVQAFFPLVNRMGPRITSQLDRYGFYPAAGGRFTVTIHPSPRLTGLDLLERGEIEHRSVTALVAHLSPQVGEREIAVAAKKLGWPPTSFHVHSSIASSGPGNVLLVELRAEHVCEVFTGFGRVGVTAEQVAHEVIQEVRNYLASGVPVGRFLADQLLLPLSVAAWKTGHGGSFRTLSLSCHATTHIDLLRAFLEIPIHVERTGNSCLVTAGA